MAFAIPSQSTNSLLSTHPFFFFCAPISSSAIRPSPPFLIFPPSAGCRLSILRLVPINNNSSSSSPFLRTPSSPASRSFHLNPPHPVSATSPPPFHRPANSGSQHYNLEGRNFGSAFNHPHLHFLISWKTATVAPAPPLFGSISDDSFLKTTK